MRKYLLAFDADCGPCTRFRRVIGFFDTHRRLEFVPLVQADNEGLLNPVPPSRRHRSFHLVSPEGNVLSGANAIPTLVGLLPAGRPFSKLVVSAPGGLPAVGFVYATFSRLHDSGSCHYRPGSSPLNSGGKPRAFDVIGLLKLGLA